MTFRNMVQHPLHLGTGICTLHSAVVVPTVTPILDAIREVSPLEWAKGFVDIASLSPEDRGNTFLVETLMRSKGVVPTFVYQFRDPPDGVEVGLSETIASFEGNTRWATHPSDPARGGRFRRWLLAPCDYIDLAIGQSIRWPQIDSVCEERFPLLAQQATADLGGLADLILKFAYKIREKSPQ